MRKDRTAPLRRPPGWVAFALAALVWTVALTLLWSKISPWTSWPVAALSQFTLEQSAPMWVRSVHRSLGTMEVETTIEMPVADAAGRLGELAVEVDPARYAYGLPIFLALLFAARGRGRAARALVGYLMLLPAQAFSVTMFVLMQMVLFAQASARVLKVSHWQVEAIVYGYQIGSLVVPTLVPIVLWLWLDREFFASLVARSRWSGGAQKQETTTAVALSSTESAQVKVPCAQDEIQAQAAQTLEHADATSEASDAARPEASLVSSSASVGLPQRRRGKR